MFSLRTITYTICQHGPKDDRILPSKMIHKYGHRIIAAGRHPGALYPNLLQDQTRLLRTFVQPGLENFQG